MKFLNKTKMLLKASVVIAIALAFVMPVTAATSKSSLINTITLMNQTTSLGVQNGLNKPQVFGIHLEASITCSAVDENIAWAVVL